MDGGSPRPRKRLARLALALGSAALALLAVEASLRAVEPRGPFLQRLEARILNSRIAATPADRAHPAFGYTLTPSRSIELTRPRPHRVVTNALGFRAAEPAQAAAGRRKLLLLGDSMLFGVGVDGEETVAAALERELGIEALNLALIGYNPVQYLAVGGEMIPRLSPDHVVVGLFIGNDLLACELATLEAGRYRVDTTAMAGWQLRDRLPLGGRSAIERRVALTLLAPRWRYELAARDPIVRRNVALMLSLEAVARDAEAGLTVLLIPTVDALADGWRARWSGSRTVLSLYRRELEAAGLEVASLEPNSELGRRARDAFFPRDRHPNALGNRLIAEELATHLRRTWL